MTTIKNFFYKSEELDYFVLKPLSHINSNWELSCDRMNLYRHEDNSFAKLLNELIFELNSVVPYENYHDNEDFLAEYVKEHLNWNIKKIGKFWQGADYLSILEQGGFYDKHEKHLILALAGRIRISINYNQLTFDDMEKAHKKILANILSIILYHRFFSTNRINSQV